MFDRSNLRPSFLHGLRAPATPPCNVQPTVSIDEPADDPIWDIQNRTLGFQKIFAVSMPHRTDKRDYLALMALASDLDIEFIDGVDGSLMHPKTIPYFWKGENGTGTLGCWRAHIDIFQRMVSERIQSALVLEDDADWDVLIKSQMTELARGTRHLQNATLPLHSPYGDNWDLITVGNIGTNNNPTREQEYWITKNDPTVIAPSRRAWSRMPDLSAPSLGGDYTRVVHVATRFSATHGYAISLRGAARMLYDQTMKPNAQAIDLAMANVCRYNYWGQTPFCLGAFPMIIGRFRAAGPLDKDSDRRTATNEATPGAGGNQGHGEERVEHESEFTVFPVSLNLERLLKSEAVIPAQKPQIDYMGEVNLQKFVFPRGEPVLVKPDEYVNLQKAKQAAGKPVVSARDFQS
jgi:GR25 family glycosyltransferase involved in LPS biosynthesis